MNTAGGGVRWSGRDSPSDLVSSNTILGILYYTLLLCDLWSLGMVPSVLSEWSSTSPPLTPTTELRNLRGWGHYGNICQVSTRWRINIKRSQRWLTIMLVLNIYKYIWPFSHSKGIIFFATFIEKFWLQSFLLEIWCCIAYNFWDPGKKGTTLSNFCWTSVTVRQSSDQPGVENGEMDHWRKTNSGGKS